MSKHRSSRPEPQPLPYPYLAVRLMPAVGIYRPVEFVRAPAEAGSDPHAPALLVADPEPATPEGELTPARRAAAVEAVSQSRPSLSSSLRPTAQAS